MSDTYYCAVIMDVWMRGGDPDQVSRTRVEMCMAHTPATEVARLEVELQRARAQVAADIQRITMWQS